MIFLPATCAEKPINGRGAHGIARRSRCRNRSGARRVYVEFEAVRQVAEVYLNGHYLGVCKNGFIPFGFDLTPYFKFGEPNVLAVMCDNRFMISDIAGGDSTRQGKENGENGDLSGTNTVVPRTLAEYEKEVNSFIPGDVDELQANQIPWNNPQWHPAHGRDLSQRPALRDRPASHYAAAL